MPVNSELILAPVASRRVAAEADRADVREILRRGSKSFFAASRLLPRRVREPATVLYAFLRVADDLVDAPGAGAEAVEALQARLDGVFAGQPGAHPVDRALAEVVRTHALPRLPFDLLIEGFEWDTSGAVYRDLGELVTYCVRVAGTVGVLMTILMGRRDPTTLARACDLGVAMQLTNVARDVGEDARRGRIYLPRDWLAEARVDTGALVEAPRFTAGLGDVVGRLLSEAERLYVSADAGIARLPRDCRPAIRAARLIYADIGREIRVVGGDSVSRRAAVSARRKIWLLLRALPAMAWRPHPYHRPTLEAASEVVAGAASEVSGVPAGVDLGGSPRQPLTEARGSHER